MRPAGEVRLAILGAALSLVPPSVRTNPQASRPTLREIAHTAQVGLRDATHTVKNMARAGDLRKVRERKVAYCNKPVAEYEPVLHISSDVDARRGHGWVDLGRVVGGWAR